MLSRSRRRTIEDLLIQALLIVFSLLLALGVNRWRDQHEARQRLAASEQHVRVELEHNRVILQNMIPYHEAVVQRIGRYLARPDLADEVRGHAFMDLAGKLMPRGFWNPTVSPKELSDSAWQSALSDRSASLMTPQLINRLTAYYELQNNGVQRTLRYITGQFLNPKMYDTTATVLMLRASQGWFSELAAEEKTLLANTNDDLAALPAHGRH